MKTPVAITLIIVGALLVVTPVIINFIDRQQDKQEGNTISIDSSRPWGSTASMAIGGGLIGLTALLATKKDDPQESIYVPKDHDLGQVDSSIRGELQKPSQSATIPIHGVGAQKPDVPQAKSL